VKYVATVDGVDVAVEVLPGERPGTFTVVAGGETRHVDVAPTARGWLFSLLIDGRSYEVAREAGQLTVGGRTFTVEVERDLGVGRAGRAGAAGGPASLKAPIPGLVVAVQAAVGDEVHEGQPLVILEAMKMQMELKSPRAGHVTEIAVESGREVPQGLVLLIIGE
jgi:biotin carboxyl carrier protein